VSAFRNAVFFDGLFGWCEMRINSEFDRYVGVLGKALGVLASAPKAGRVYPPNLVVDVQVPVAMSEQERRLSGSLMRVNHVGEVCAQALYEGQALMAKEQATKDLLLEAANEEADHLAWTAQRLKELGARQSLLNPVWYAGSLGLGMLAGRLGSATSLGFVVETEKQVEHHLHDHLQRLPANDTTSRVIVEQMQADEARHGRSARQAGAVELPKSIQAAMRLSSKVMTTVAAKI
jgi:3-demethoxyubiquinol 3-hydroxylase